MGLIFGCLWGLKNSPTMVVGSGFREHPPHHARSLMQQFGSFESDRPSLLFKALLYPQAAGEANQGLLRLHDQQSLSVTRSFGKSRLSRDEPYAP